nr:MAG TPA: hypothetical protein [Caudoviricetes sp.]
MRCVYLTSSTIKADLYLGVLQIQKNTLLAC